jgi:signal transduction histidine kinase
MGERGGRLILRFRREGGDLMIEVSDTGRGIPSEIRDRLFGTFVTAGKAHGTGLGLSIVKKIVEEHAGSVDVETSSAGTTFSLRLPQTDESTAHPAVRRGAGSNAKKKARSGSPRAAKSDLKTPS